MSRRHDIYADGGRRERERASRDIKIYLLAAAGAVGLPMLMSQCSEDDVPSAPQVSSSQVYANNSFVPGAGYYHAPYQAWFPLPYNQHDARGWYRGGQWRQQPDDRDPNAVSYGGSSGSSAGSSSFTGTSKPTPEAVAQANRAASEHHAATIRRGGFGSSGSSRSFFS